MLFRADDIISSLKKDLLFAHDIEIYNSNVKNMNQEPMSGFEPETSSLPRKRSTPELHRQCRSFGMTLLSGRPGSNRRHSAWKADALPTELLPHY